MGPLLATIATLWGCDTIGSINDRAQIFNKVSADYSAATILYNILRAKGQEPLQFVDLTGVTGHNTLSVSLGLPTFILGPDKTESERLFVFGPNVVGGTNSNDFNVSVLDDPKSYAALLAPVDPAALGFLISSGYEPARILFLFISRIQVFRNGIKYEDLNQDISTFRNETYAFNESYKQFYDKLNGYVDQGLSIKVDPTFVPGSGNAANESICFDEKWINPQRYPTLYNHITRLQNPCYATLDGKQATDSASQDHDAKYRFVDQENAVVVIQTRSLYGAYRYLGELLLIRDQLLQSAKDIGEIKEILMGSSANDLLYINHDRIGCWVSVVYEGDQWCVPANAVGTKRTFEILHALFHLYAAPENQPATPTVRVTPG
jgi:hypothetical protein